MIEVLRELDRDHYTNGARTPAEKLKVLQALLDDLKLQKLKVSSIVRHEDLVEHPNAVVRGGWAAYA